MRRETIAQPARAGSQPGERVRPIRRVDKLNYSDRMNAVAGGRAGEGGRHCWTKRACRGCGNSVDDDGVPAGVQSWLPLRVSQTVRVLMRWDAEPGRKVRFPSRSTPSRPGRAGPVTGCGRPPADNADRWTELDGSDADGLHQRLYCQYVDVKTQRNTSERAEMRYASHSICQPLQSLVHPLAKLHSEFVTP